MEQKQKYEVSQVVTGQYNFIPSNCACAHLIQKCSKYVRSLVSTHRNLLKKGLNLAHLSCSFVSKQGTIFLYQASETINRPRYICMCPWRYINVTFSIKMNVHFLFNIINILNHFSTSKGLFVTLVCLHRHMVSRNRLACTRYKNTCISHSY